MKHETIRITLNQAMKIAHSDEHDMQGDVEFEREEHNGMLEEQIKNKQGRANYNNQLIIIDGISEL